MKTVIFILLGIVTVLVSCKKEEDTIPVKVQVYGSHHRYNLLYFRENKDIYPTEMIVDSGYTRTFWYHVGKLYNFTAEIMDTAGWVVIKVETPNRVYYDSIAGGPKVGAHITPDRAAKQ